MARTSQAKQPAKRKVAPSPRLQGPEDWTPEALLAALHCGTLEEDIALLHTIGILNKKGELARKYRTWGRKVSRTMVWNDDTA
jgi:hypothetical protein